MFRVSPRPSLHQCLYDKKQFIRIYIIWVLRLKLCRFPFPSVKIKIDEEINKSTLLMFLPWFRLSPIGYYSQNTRCLYLHAAHIKILLFMKFQGQQGKGWILCVVLIVRSWYAIDNIDPVLASCKKRILFIFDSEDQKCEN